MSRLQSFVSRANGWALSLMLHGGIAALACLSVMTVQIGGGSGNGNGGASGSSYGGISYAATVHPEDALVNGTPLPDTAIYGRLTPEDTTLEPVTEELPTPSVPFDVFAVGSSEQTTPILDSPPDDPRLRHSAPAEGRSVKLPPAAGDGKGDGDEGAPGSGGSGGGGSEGNGSGDGAGDGNATGVFTPSPSYPTDCRRRNIEGSVLVELGIEADGSCVIRRILESSGFDQLDEAVQTAVRRWKFRSSEIDGRPEHITKKLRFTFKLGS